MELKKVARWTTELTEIKQAKTIHLNAFSRSDTHNFLWLLHQITKVKCATYMKQRQKMRSICGQA